MVSLKRKVTSLSEKYKLITEVELGAKLSKVAEVLTSPQLKTCTS